MADDDREISALALAGSFTGTSELPGLHGGLNVRFNGAQISAFIGAATFVSSTVVSPADFGLIADGASHPLSTRYANLAAAQVDYYFATDLAQQIDYCACKAASNAAFGGDLELLTAYVEVSQASDDTHIYDTDQNWTVNEHAGKTAFRKFMSNGFVTSVPILSNTATVLTLLSPMPSGEIGATNQYAIGYGEHGANAKLNKKLILPPGRYIFAEDTWTIRNLVGGIIEGFGTETTVLTGNNCVIRFDGVWRSAFSNFSVLCQASDAEVAFDFDGNVVGHAYPTRGLQGTTFTGLLIDGGGSEYAFAMNRVGGSGGQGDHHVFINCDFASASFACYYQNGYNSLCNTFLGGDMQNYTQNGMFVSGGTVTVLNTSFECAQGYRQIENGGWDINVGDAGSFESCVIYGCRTESLRFLRNGGAVLVDVRGIGGQIAVPGWSVSTAYGAAAPSYKAIVESARLFVATTEGTSGSGAKPDFAGAAYEGTVADNGIVWTHIPFKFIDIAPSSGTIDLGTITYDAGEISAPLVPIQYSVTTVDVLLLLQEHTKVVDATAGPVTVTLPSPMYPALRGKQFTIKKVDTSANAVTINTVHLAEGGGTTLTIPGGTRGSLTIEWHDGDGGSAQWLIMARV